MPGGWSEWQRLDTPQALESALGAVCAFHDSCLVCLRYTSGAYVEEGSLSMLPSNAARTLTVTLHQQFAAHYETELRFEGVRAAYLAPADPGQYDCIICGAALFLRDGWVYWADDEGFDPAHPCETSNAWVCAKACFWRSRPAGAAGC